MTRVCLDEGGRFCPDQEPGRRPFLSGGFDAWDLFVWPPAILKDKPVIIEVSIYRNKRRGTCLF